MSVVAPSVGVMEAAVRDKVAPATGSVEVFDVSGLDAAATLSAVEDQLVIRRRAEARDLALAAHWADLHAADPQPGQGVRREWNGQDRLVDFGGEGADSYRAYRAKWTGRPADDPALAATRGENGVVTAYASWNGATEVAQWQLVAGPDAERMNPVATVPKAGFETKLTAQTAEPFVRARALAADGTVLGTSDAVELAE